jgi:hypothetical protein
MRKTIFSFTLLATFALASCGGKDNSCSTSKISDAAEKVSDAGIAYTSDPTNTQKCQDYKDAVDDYLETVDGCPDVSQEQIDAVKQGIAGLNCQ